MKKNIIRLMLFGVLTLMSASLWAQSPGGVGGTDFRLWLKSDTGVTENSGKVSALTSQSPVVGSTFTQSNIHNMPNLVDDAVNFNPSLEFVHSEALACLGCNPSVLPNQVQPNGDELHVVYVAIPTAVNSKHTIFEIEGAGSHPDAPAFEIRSNKVGIDADGSGFQDSGYHSSVTLSENTPIMVSTFWNNRDTSSTVGETQGRVVNTINGYNQSVITKGDGTTPKIGNDIILGAGDSNGNGDEFEGYLPEVVMYNKELSAVELQKVHSYLAVKYGLTMGNTTAIVNYVNSAGLTVWMGNGTYQNGVFGIGADNGSDLNQQISHPIEDQDIVLSTDNDFTSANGSHGISLADNSYVMLGHNGGEEGFSSVNYSGANVTNANSISSRHWLVQETGTVGNIWVKSNKAGATYVIQSSDANFNDSDTWILLDGNQAAQINLMNGEYITFAGYLTGPGGQSANMTAWFKADQDVVNSGDGTKVSQWGDISGNPSFVGNQPVQSKEAYRPTYYESRVNFYPAVSFDYKRWLDTDSNMTSSDLRDVANGKVSAYVVARSTSFSYKTSYGNDGVFFDHGGTGASNTLMSTDRAALGHNNVGYTADVSIDYNVVSAVRNGSSLIKLSNGLNNLNNSPTTVSGNVDANSIFSLGRNTAGGDYLKGDIAEIIIYDNNHDVTERTKVESYLAVKYGVTLGNTSTTVNYLSSSGTVVWLGNSTYQNGVFGIARDAGANLNHQISTPAEDQDVVLSTDNDFVSVNGSHSASLINNTYIMLGHNGGSEGLVSVNYSGINSNTANSISPRHWLVQETGTVGNVWIKSNDEAATYLIQSSDATFNDSDTWTLLDGNQAVEVDLADGEYVTFAGYLTGPGGELANMTAWFKASQNVSSLGDGAPVTQWDDLSGNTAFVANQPVQSNTAYQPDYHESKLNYYPVVSFDGSDWLDTNSNMASSDLRDVVNGKVSAYVVANRMSTNDDVYFDHGGVGTQNTLLSSRRIGLGHSNKDFATEVDGNYTIINAVRNGASLTASFDGLNNLSNNPETVSGTNDVNSIFTIGRNTAGGDDVTGDIAEIVIYDNNHNATQKAKVESYLAVKYGLTLGNTTATIDYVNSSGTVVWTGNSSYQNGVFGIARDAGASLNQQISTPVEDKDIILSADNDFISANGSHGGSLDNNSYVMLGHNGGDAGFSSVNYSGANENTANSISSRHWLVQETGTVGNIWIKSNDAGSTYVIQSSDTNFDDSDTWTQLNFDQVANIDLANGEYIAFGGFVTGPGGVGGESFRIWLKSDEGVTESSGKVSELESQSTYSSTFMEETTGDMPNLIDNVINFNPSLEFLGSQALGCEDCSPGIVDNQEDSNGDPLHVVYMALPSAVNSKHTIFEFEGTGSAADAPAFEINSSRPGIDVDNSNFENSGFHSSYTFSANTPVMVSTFWNNRDGNSTIGETQGRVVNTVNGYDESIITANDGTTNKIGNDVFFGAGDSNGNGDEFEGYLPEVIMYTKELTATELQKVHSYLAIKYGLTMGNAATTVDYLSSAGATVWTGDATYQNDIVGLAGDFASSLSQQISKSLNTTSILTLSTDKDFTSANGLHTAIDTNNSYVIAGNDGGSTATVASNSSNVPSMAIYPTRITRQWKVEVTGYDQAINMKFDGGYDDTYAVLLDDDGDFSSGGSVLGFLNASGELLGATLPAGASYFTLVQPEDIGFDLIALDTTYVIDFDTTVAGINDGQIDGTGLSYDSGITGRLNSRGVVVRGIDGVNTDFGGDYTTGDFALGTSVGGASTGGLYAFEVGIGDHALGLSPDTDDLSTGSVSIAFTNKTGTEITELLVSYELYHYNNGAGTHQAVFGLGASIQDSKSVLETSLESDTAITGNPKWERNYVTGKLTGLSVAAGESLVLTWSTSASSDEIALDDISIVANPLSATSSLSGEVYDVKVLGADLDINGTTDIVDSMTINGGIVTTNDNLVFKSSAGKSAVLNEVLNGGTITGNVIVEQYYAAQRAFRFVSSPVNMNETVFDNWQQGGLNVGDLGYEAGSGTHITGGTLGLGFDQTGSNNPSMFNFSNDDVQSWLAVGSTNGLTLSAGDAYRLFVRGDRSVELFAPVTTGIETTLKTEGTLTTGDVVNSYASDLSTGDYIHVGNPYQARLDIETVLNDAATEDINTIFGYYWNPLSGTEGAYRLYNYIINSSVPTDSQVDGVLQPSQSMLLQIDSDGDGDAPSLTFRESAKVEGSTMLSTFSTPQSTLQLDVYKDVTAPALDGVHALFSTNGNDGVDSLDATKLGNPSENIALLNGSSYLILENRSLPQDGTALPLYTWGFTTGDYVFNLNVNGLGTGLNAYLHDALTGEYTDINTGSLLSKSVSFDESNTASMDALRFSIVFSNTTLSVLDELATSNISVYPNPVVSDDLTVSGLETGKTSIALYTLSGQIIFNREYDVTARELTVGGVKGLSNGVYLLQVTQGEQSNTVKVVVSK